eukprot:Sspe_Gene.31348::Locus_15475_Transcript_1_1_Confidence_1.000_Length_1816::g.31348::m.31348
MQVVQAWERITKRVMLPYLRKPATQCELRQLEAELEMALPIDLRESLLIHDGQSILADTICKNHSLCGISEMRRGWDAVTNRLPVLHPHVFYDLTPGRTPQLVHAVYERSGFADSVAHMLCVFSSAIARVPPPREVVWIHDQVYLRCHDIYTIEKHLAEYRHRVTNSSQLS